LPDTVVSLGNQFIAVWADMSGKTGTGVENVNAGVPAAALDKLADERRRAQRRRSVIAGRIVGDRLQGSVSCVVRDLSATGAQLDLKFSKTSVISSIGGLPDQFILILERERSEVMCETAWRHGESAGVRFVGGFRAMPKAPAPLIRKK
jgi:hypothetical protein